MAMQAFQPGLTEWQLGSRGSWLSGETTSKNYVEDMAAQGMMIMMKTLAMLTTTSTWEESISDASA